MNKFVLIDEYGYKKYKYLKKIIRYCLKIENVKDVSFTIILTDDEVVHKLNREYRNIDQSTDVLSFVFEECNNICYNKKCIGEIYISIPKMMSQAKEYGHSEKRELAFLSIHGLLHLLGYDHVNNVEEEKEMFTKQELVLNEFKETRNRKEEKEF